ncbi:uncharacterized protein LOC141905049 [Tubulanus polymorphus]|uniref:uncharacterized protein LOC141905049 n=1 Tax=Tubulanus polymorphus TaxID=672921 RepID=UPI003DA614A3
MTHKRCPKCHNKIPVACKSCKCGHKFQVRSKLAIDDKGKTRFRPPTNISERKKRLVRVRKVTAQYQASIPARLKQIRKKVRENVTGAGSTDRRPVGRPRKNPINPSVSSSSNSATSETSGIQHQRTKRQMKCALARARDEAEKVTANQNEETYSNLSAEKALQYSIILAELNRKYAIQTFKPI